MLPYSFLYATGASLVDFRSANARAAQGRRPPRQFARRSWVHQLKSEHGIARRVVVVAMGGAKALDSDNRGRIDKSFGAQCDRILKHFVARGRPGNAALTVLVGGNDLIRLLREGDEPAQARELVDEIVAVVADDVHRLSDAGLSRIIFLTHPGGHIPLVLNLDPPVREQAQAVVKRMNDRLGEELGTLPGSIRIDLAGFFERVQADPQRYGFARFDRRRRRDRPRDVFFLDDVHPNRWAHRAIAAFVAGELRAVEPQAPPRTLVDRISAWLARR